MRQCQETINVNAPQRGNTEQTTFTPDLQSLLRHFYFFPLNCLPSPRLIQAPLNNSPTPRRRSSGGWREQKYLNVFPFEGLMAAVFVTNRVECWVGDGFYRNRVRGAKRKVRRRRRRVRIWKTDVHAVGERKQSNSATFTWSYLQFRHPSDESCTTVFHKINATFL